MRTGLHSWETGIEELQAAMRRIQVKNGDCFEHIKQLPDNSVDVVYFDPMFHEPVETSDGIAPLRDLAEDSVLHEGCINEAVRVARKSVVLKDHWKSPRFEQFGFNVMKRKNSTVPLWRHSNKPVIHITGFLLIGDLHDDKV